MNADQDITRAAILHALSSREFKYLMDRVDEVEHQAFAAGYKEACGSGYSHDRTPEQSWEFYQEQKWKKA